MIDNWTIDDTLRNLIEDQELLSVYCTKYNLRLVGFCPDREQESGNLRYFFNDGHKEGHSYFDLVDDMLRNTHDY
jgi:hypothetical protein